MKIIGNNLANNLTTVFTGICSACAIGGIMFLWHLKEKVPEIEKGQIRLEKKMDDMQGSINGLSTRFSNLSEEQIRQQGKIDNLTDKIDKKGH